jgi:hypothetical protein
MAMAYSAVEIRLGGLVVSVSTEMAYPDGMDDLCARTLSIFKEGVTTAKSNDIDITTMTLHTSDYGDDYEED